MLNSKMEIRRFRTHRQPTVKRSRIAYKVHAYEFFRNHTPLEGYEKVMLLNIQNDIALRNRYFKNCSTSCKQCKLNR